MGQKRIFWAYLFGFFVIVFGAVCFGGTITVNWDGSGDYTTIQAAIDAAIEGDTVIVDVGTYHENISFGGKDITLTSTNPEDMNVAAATIIEGGGNSSVVMFAGTETANCVLTGFAITNGYSYYGGGIYGDGTKATISNCTISCNIAGYSGGGLDSCDGTINNCTISGNVSGYDGGGLAYCDGTIINCTITGNSTFLGGALYRCDGVVNNCTIAGNKAVYSGGLFDCDGTIVNCIIVENSNQLDNSSTPTYSCIEDWIDGGEGNIDVDPEFAAAGYWDPNDTPEDEEDDFWVEGDYHLQWDSPCINTGDPNFIPEEGEVDIDGEPRVMGGRVDMGADEVGPKQADFTRDGVINIDDFGVLGNSWGTGPGDEKWYVLCDLWEDGGIDIVDLAAFVEDWMWVY